MRDKKKILIIDDESLIQKSWAHVARTRGHKYQTAGTGKEGLEIWKAWKPDLVFLDLSLPDTNGLALMEVAPSSVVILMSAYGQFKEQALEKGAFLFLEKPFNNVFQIFDDILSKINHQGVEVEL